MKKTLLFLFAIVIAYSAMSQEVMNPDGSPNFDNAIYHNFFTMVYYLNPKKTEFMDKPDEKKMEKFFRTTTVIVSNFEELSLTQFCTTTDTFSVYLYHQNERSFYCFKNATLKLKAPFIKKESDKIAETSTSDFKSLGIKQFGDITANLFDFKTKNGKKESYVTSDKFPPINGIFNLLYNNTALQYYPLEFTIFVDKTKLVFSNETGAAYYDNAKQQNGNIEYRQLDFKETTIDDILRTIHIK